MRPCALPSIRPLFLAAALACSLAGQASADSAVPDLQLSADGSEVIDLRARLVWPRCVHGMEWREQRCQGSPQRLVYGPARQLALSQHKADGLRWRLPRTNELRRLQQRAVAFEGLFPQVPGDWHWTGTAAVNARPVNRYSYEQTGPAKNSLSTHHAWAVHWATGEAHGEMGRGNALLVRLVRPLQASEVPSRPTLRQNSQPTDEKL